MFQFLHLVGIERYRPYSSDKCPVLDCEEIVGQIIPPQLEIPFHSFERAYCVLNWYLDNGLWLVSGDNEGGWIEWLVEGNVVGAGVCMFRKWVGHGIGFLWRNRDGFIVYEVLDCMAEAKAIVGWMAHVLMVGAVGIGIMGSGKFLWEWSRRKWFKDITFDQLFKHCGERC
jgi:hypothetical protein